MLPKAKSLGLLIKNDKILLEEQKGKHSKGTGLFYRPIGGTIEDIINDSKILYPNELSEVIRENK